MTRDALIRELRKYARLKDLTFEVFENNGKGSHYRIKLGEQFTTVKSGELKPGYVKLIKKQLGVI
ncbi:hypothetical protein NKI19_01965 [Mesorhizobium sp. M0751]|uniref:type II toxin-antitoxin system HicA family toxin n=1 Tax=unclassified Mesorhizobium TaxID=325217 RepID=UPI00333984FA